jgi:hypothetical protein
MDAKLTGVASIVFIYVEDQKQTRRLRKVKGAENSTSAKWLLFEDHYFQRSFVQPDTRALVKMKIEGAPAQSFE